MKIYYFKDFIIDTFERKLTQNGSILKISPKAFDILQMLIENSGQLVTKADIIEQLWPDTFIEENNIAVHISAIRKTLGTTEENSLIENVPGVGYRFVCRVTDNQESLFQTAANFDFQSSSQTTRESIAIIPFQNVEKNPEIEFLADGLTETFINSFSEVANLRVISRDTIFSFKDSELSAREIGKKLGARKVLTGRLKTINNQLVLDAELINVEDDAQLWGTKIRRPFSDIFEIQNQIISEVRDHLILKLGGPVKNQATDLHGNQESYRAYLKANHFLANTSPQNLLKSVEHFEKAIMFYPLNSMAYAGLIRNYLAMQSFDLIQLNEARAQISRLVYSLDSLNISTAETEAAIGMMELRLNWDFPKAETHFKKAFELKPNSTEILYRYIEIFVLSGRFSEALEIIRRGDTIDSISIGVLKKKAAMFFLMGQITNSISLSREIIELYPNNWIGTFILGVNLAFERNRDEAIKNLKYALNLENSVDVLSAIGYAEARGKNKVEAFNCLAELENISAHKFVPAVYFAYVYSGLGDVEKTFEYIEKSISERNVEMIALKVDPRWESVRNDPRFSEFVKKVGIPI